MKTDSSMIEMNVLCVIDTELVKKNIPQARTRLNRLELNMTVSIC